LNLKNETISKIHDILIDIIDTDMLQFDETFNLIDDIGLTSLDAIEFVMALEDEFDIDIDDVQFKSWEVLGQVYDTVSELLNNDTKEWQL